MREDTSVFTDFSVGVGGGGRGRASRAQRDYPLSEPTGSGVTRIHSSF